MKSARLDFEPWPPSPDDPADRRADLAERPARPPGKDRVDAARTVVRPARHDVDVDVGDRLPRRGAVVDADRRAGGAERLADRAREAEHGLEQCGGGGGLELLDRGDVR